MIMKKLFTFLTLLTLAITTAWAGEQTITISRKDGQFDNAQGVYYASKGGVTMTMSGGMNNTNFLVLRHQNTVTFRSANFAIKKIIFHCLDDFKEGNNDVFYWGPTTMNVMTVNYKPAGSSTTTAVVPGKFTASGYDGTWVSSFSGTWTSTFRPTNGSGTETRTHTSFANGWPAGNQLIFGSLGKPVRFSSIDIVVEKEDGDIYDLVTNVSQIQTQHNYLIVNWENAKALSVNTKLGRNSKDVRTGSPVEFISGQVDGIYDQYAKVKTDGEAQIIKFEKHTLPISTSSGQINNSRAWTFNAGGNYLRIYSSAATGQSGNNGPDLYGESSIDPEWSYAAIWLGASEAGYNVRIRFRDMSTTNYPRPTSSTYQMGYNRSNNYFRDLDYANYGNATAQQVRLYTPAEPYNVTTEVQPDASYGAIALRDGVIVSDNTYTSGTSQQYETVSFMVTPAVDKKISSVTIQAGTETIEPQSATHTTNGTIYTFVMPASDVHIIAEFADVQYHNIYTEVKPDLRYGNIFLTEGYVVQDNQVKSYEGENVVFNVMANLKDIANESSGYYELSYVTVKDHVTGVETTIAADQLGNYNFTMPDNDVTITANFNEPAPDKLYLLGDANNLFWTYNDNGTQKWHAYGPQFKYNSTIGYYIDVYYKGTGSYGDNTGDPYGYFSLSKRYADNDDWSYLNGNRLVPSQYNGGNVDITDNELNGDNGAQTPLYTDTDANRNSAFRIPAGIYRIIVNDAMTQMTVIRKDLSMAFDPEGGATAAEAPYISKGTEVTMNTALYNEILAVNSNITTPANTPSYPADNEPTTNFYYKVSTSTDGATYNDVTTASTTNVSTTLNTVNEGITVTEVTATNYLGWITVPGTNYYKVIETPLHWIEHPDKGVEGHKYIVSDRLMGVYAMNNILWAKDVDFDSNNASEKPAGAIDYMRYFTDYMANTAPEGYRSNLTQADAWEQKNWVQLDFSNIEHGDQLAINLVNKYMKAGSVRGTYVDDENYRIVLSAEPEQVPVSESGALNYQPNYYCPMNFMSYHGVSDASDYVAGNDVIVQGPTANGKYYYLLNPKIQEYALITFAVWDKANQRFVVPAKDIDVNEANLDGAFEVEWDYNNWDNPDPDVVADQRANMDKFEDAQAYTFHAIIQKPVTAVVSPSASAPARIEPKADQTPTGNYIVYPLDLVVGQTHIVTAVQTVTAGKAVQSVTYCDLAGRMSRRPLQGVNIIVTRYTDGTVTTSKAVF